jgi:hypothetical protein
MTGWACCLAGLVGWQAGCLPEIACWLGFLDCLACRLAGLSCCLGFRAVFLSGLLSLLGTFAGCARRLALYHTGSLTCCLALFLALLNGWRYLLLVLLAVRLASLLSCLARLTDLLVLLVLLGWLGLAG